MGLKSRNKGKRGEREAAAEIRKLFRTDASRGCQFAGGKESPDIRTSIPRVHFEVKRAETIRLYDALNQAIADAGENLPIVLHKQNRQPWLAIVRLEDLPQLAVQLYLTLAQNQ
jgi:hypothetical protein